jgi:hypothetical protein
MEECKMCPTALQPLVCGASQYNGTETEDRDRHCTCTEPVYQHAADGQDREKQNKSRGANQVQDLGINNFQKTSWKWLPLQFSDYEESRSRKVVTASIRAFCMQKNYILTPKISFMNVYKNVTDVFIYSLCNSGINISDYTTLKDKINELERIC